MFPWIGRFCFFSVEVLRATFLRAPHRARVLEEAYRVGVQSLPVLVTISAFVGSILVIQGHRSFSMLGAQHLTGMFVALAGIRELSPIVAATMVAAKAGTEMASQLAVMRTREQIDALEVMAVDPYWYLVTPRLLGIMLVMPALTAVALFVTVLAGVTVATFQLGLDPDDFERLVLQYTTGRDLLIAEAKAVVFAFVICMVSTFSGFYSARGPEGVGQATNAAVVISAVVCVILNFIVSQVAYGGS